MESATPTITPPRVEFDNDVAVRRDDGDADYSGWFCVKTNPWPCPADGCGFVAHYMTAAHLVVVWPRKDDPALLGQAAAAQRLGRAPRVIDYEVEFGYAIAWDEWVRINRPIHGRIERPDDWDQDAWRL